MSRFQDKLDELEQTNRELAVAAIRAHSLVIPLDELPAADHPASITRLKTLVASASYAQLVRNPPDMRKHLRAVQREAQELIDQLDHQGEPHETQQQ